MTNDRQKAARLDPLTSLRFIAAAMIVLLHTEGAFGLPKRAFDAFPLEQGVSFFFVLSGFILTYVYPDLSAPGAKGRFLWTRVARIWPLHLATLLVALVVIPDARLFPFGGDLSEKTGIIAVNAFLLQSLVPNIKYYFSMNAVSWSISTELFFYLAFPILIVAWRRTWKWKLLLATGLLVGLLAACELLGIPGYKGGYQGVTVPGLTYVNPFARVFEFVLGMCMAHAFARLSPGIRLGRSAATALEVLMIGLIVGGMYLALALEAPVARLFGNAFAWWLGNAGISIFFSVLILVFAFGRGWLSRLLSLRGFVLLGEISFAVYMVHQIIIRLHVAYDKEMLGMEPWQIYPLFWVVTLAVSYLLWRYLEMPARKHLAALWPRLADRRAGREAAEPARAVGSAPMAADAQPCAPLRP